MKYISNTKELSLVIEEDSPDIGAYLYVYNSHGDCIADYLQDDVDSCKRQACETFGVALNNWKEIVSNP